MKKCFLRYWKEDFYLKEKYLIDSMDWKIREVVMI